MPDRIYLFQCLEEMMMKTRKIRTYRRLIASDAERYMVEIKLYVSQEELEKLRQKFFEEEK